jgi:prepilin peptidase CpaA
LGGFNLTGWWFREKEKEREKGILNPVEIIPLPYLGIALLIATVSDIRFHRIPNWLTYPTMAVATVYHAGMRGFEGFLFSMEGIIVGIAVLIVPFLMGGMGAGDAKLMGAVGGWLGPKDVFVAFLFSAIVGGIYALGLLILRGDIKETAKRYIATLKTFILTREFICISSRTGEKMPKLCYGLVIAAGTLISVVWGIWV